MCQMFLLKMSLCLMWEKLSFSPYFELMEWHLQLYLWYCSITFRSFHSSEVCFRNFHIWFFIKKVKFSYFFRTVTGMAFVKIVMIVFHQIQVQNQIYTIRKLKFWSLKIISSKNATVRVAFFYKWYICNIANYEISWCISLF